MARNNKITVIITILITAFITEKTVIIALLGLSGVLVLIKKYNNFQKTKKIEEEYLQAEEKAAEIAEEQKLQFQEFLKRENIDISNYKNCENSYASQINEWLKTLREDFLSQGKSMPIYSWQWDRENGYSFSNIILKSRNREYLAKVVWTDIPNTKIIGKVQFKDPDMDALFGELPGIQVNEIQYNAWYSHFKALTQLESIFLQLDILRSAATDGEVYLWYSNISNRNIKDVTEIELKALSDVLINDFSFTKVEFEKTKQDVKFVLSAKEKRFVEVAQLDPNALLY